MATQNVIVTGFEAIYDVSIPFVCVQGNKFTAWAIVEYHLMEYFYGRYCTDHFVQFRLPADHLDWFKQLDEQQYSKYDLANCDTFVSVEQAREAFTVLHNIKEKNRVGAACQIPAKYIRIRANAGNDYILPAFKRNGEIYVPRQVLADTDGMNITITSNSEYLYLKIQFTVFPGTSVKRGVNNQVECISLSQMLAVNKNINYDDEYWPEYHTIQTVSPFPWKTHNNIEPENNNNILEPNEQTSWKEFKAKKPVKSTSVGPKNPKVDKSKKTAAAPKKKNTKQGGKIRADTFYEIESMLGYRKDKTGKEFVLIHWKGYSSDVDSWEPVEHLNAEAAKDVDKFRVEREKRKKNEAKK